MRDFAKTGITVVCRMTGTSPNIDKAGFCVVYESFDMLGMRKARYGQNNRI